MTEYSTKKSYPNGYSNAQQLFWLGAEQGKLMLPRCIDTGKCFFYPRDHSPFTGGEIDWLEASGNGSVYSFCTSGRDELYCLAYIELDEGPIMLSNVLSQDLHSIKIGQRVKVSFQNDSSGRPAPFFTLC